MLNTYGFHAEALVTTNSPVNDKYQMFVDKLRTVRRHPLVSPARHSILNYLKWSGSIYSQNVPLLYLPGRGEASTQWAELARDMRTKYQFYGSAYVLDHRGQGLSERLDPARSDVGDIENFQDYVVDLREMIALIRRQNRGQKPLVVAHSMGAAILMKALMEEPDLVDKVALITPMFDINFGPAEALGEGLAGAIIHTVAFFRPRLALSGKKGIVSVNDPEQVKTSDPVRAEVRWRLLQKYHAYMPKKTIRWVAENLKATKEILAGAHKVKTSVIMFAAENDHVVELQRMIDISCQMPSCQLKILPGAYHAAHEEIDQIRIPMLEDIANFFRGSPAEACDRLLTI